MPVPRVIDTVASEVDVMPTVAGLTGVECVNTSFGKDLFNAQFDESRFAFTIIHSPVPQLGLIGADFYYQVNADGKSARLFKLDPEAPIADHAGDNPEIAERRRSLCLGIYETARYVRHNNTPEDVAIQLGG